MIEEPICPGCRESLETIATNGRPDDLYICSSCYHSWFRFELTDSVDLGDNEPNEFGADLQN